MLMCAPSLLHLGLDIASKQMEHYKCLFITIYLQIFCVCVRKRYFGERRLKSNDHEYKYMYHCGTALLQVSSE